MGTIWIPCSVFQMSYSGSQSTWRRFLIETWVYWFSFYTHLPVLVSLIWGCIKWNLPQVKKQTFSGNCKLAHRFIAFYGIPNSIDVQGLVTYSMVIRPLDLGFGWSLVALEDKNLPFCASWMLSYLLEQRSVQLYLHHCKRFSVYYWSKTPSPSKHHRSGLLTERM